MGDTMMCEFCGYEMPQEKSKCPKCRRYNIPNMSEDEVEKQRLSEIESEVEERITGGPWDLCFGGGIMPGCVTLLAGDAGVGKSTLLLQIADHVAKEDIVVYVPTEEGEGQLKERANRIGIKWQKSIWVVNGLGGDGDIKLEKVFDDLEPALIIVDSLPGFFGDIQPDRALELVNWMKVQGVTAILSNHINKDEKQAGYKSVEHAVDALMMLMHDDKLKGLRRLLTTKNRHGPAPVDVAFTMGERGLALWAEK